MDLEEKIAEVTKALGCSKEDAATAVNAVVMAYKTMLTIHQRQCAMGNTWNAEEAEQIIADFELGLMRFLSQACVAELKRSALN